MNNKIFGMLVSAILISILGITGCSSAVTGSGQLETKTYDFSGFTTIEASHGFIVSVQQGDTFSVEVTTDDNIDAYLDVVQYGDRIDIGLKGMISFLSATLKASVTMPELEGIELSGGSRADISGFNSSNDFSITLSGGSVLSGDIKVGDIGFGISGGSRVELTGSGNNLMARSSGGSKMIMPDFPVNYADINIDGGGSADINVSDKLDTVLTGGSKLIYSGDPEMGTVSVSGGSNISKK